MVKDSTNELTKNHTLYNLANYSVEFDYRPKRRGGGTSLYIHSCLQYKSRDDLNPIRSGGGFKSPSLRIFAITHLILELHYCTLVTFPKK